MQSKHILNIGYPKCATTWLWDQLAAQSWFSSIREKENYDLIRGISVKQYTQEYSISKITGNFCPANYVLDRYIINQLSTNENIITTIIFRNPFDLYWSLYNFLENNLQITYSNYVRILLEQRWFGEFSKIIDRWQQYFSSDRFFIFSYDDLINDQQKFVIDYSNKLNIPNIQIIKKNKLNVTAYRYSNNLLDNDLIVKRNNAIDDLNQKVPFSISHWKRSII
jgi:hypothetical protein